MKSQGIQMLSVYITEIMIKQRTHNPCLSRQRWGEGIRVTEREGSPHSPPWEGVTSWASLFQKQSPVPLAWGTEKAEGVGGTAGEDTVWRRFWKTEN